MSLICLIINDNFSIIVSSVTSYSRSGQLQLETATGTYIL